MKNTLTRLSTLNGTLGADTPARNDLVDLAWETNNVVKHSILLPPTKKNRLRVHLNHDNTEAQLVVADFMFASLIAILLEAAGLERAAARMMTNCDVSHATESPPGMLNRFTLVQSQYGHFPASDAGTQCES